MSERRPGNFQAGGKDVSLGRPFARGLGPGGLHRGEGGPQLGEKLFVFCPHKDLEEQGPSRPQEGAGAGEGCATEVHRPGFVDFFDATEFGCHVRE